METIIYITPIIIGCLLLLIPKYSRLGSLIGGLGFIPFAIYIYVNDRSTWTLVAGSIIALLAVWRYSRPNSPSVTELSAQISQYIKPGTTPITNADEYYQTERQDSFPK